MNIGNATRLNKNMTFIVRVIIFGLIVIVGAAGSEALILPGLFGIGLSIYISLMNCIILYLKDGRRIEIPYAVDQPYMKFQQDLKR